MRVNRYNDGKEALTSVWNNNDERLGFVSKDRREDGTRYGFGIDNVGNPYRGVLDRELNTPLGTIDYGYDGDTVAAGFTPRNPYTALLQQLVNPQPQSQTANPYYIQAIKNLLGR